jgi:hypothetical protein
MTNEERKKIIQNEIIVDAYDDGEVNMSWYYYFAENLEFPISAVAKLKRRNGEVEEEEIMLVEINTEIEGELMFGFVLTMKGYVFPISLKNMVSVDTTNKQKEMFNNWLFWKRLKLLK